MANHWLQAWVDPLSGVSVEKRSGEYRLSHPSGLLVLIDSNLKPHVSLPSSLEPQFGRQFLEEQVQPRILSQQGELVLHAAMVCLPDQSCFLIMGSSGRGKSTLATSFHVNGCSLEGDDSVLVSDLDSVPKAKSIQGSARLNADTLTFLGTEGLEELPAARGGKRRFAPRSTTVWPERGFRPIRAVFILAGEVSSGIEVRCVEGISSAVAVLSNTFALDPSDTARASFRLKQSAAFVAKVPLFELSFPRDFNMLADVRTSILDLLSDHPFPNVEGSVQ